MRSCEKRIYLNEKSIILSKVRCIKYFRYNDHVDEDNKVDQEQQQYKSPRKKIHYSKNILTITSHLTTKDVENLTHYISKKIFFQETSNRMHRSKY
jgi:hypothetical protein